MNKKIKSEKINIIFLILIKKMMFKLITERTFLFIFLFSILYFSVFSKISKEKIEDFVKEKDKIEKSLNQQKLSNYLTKLMMKNDNIIDNEMYFVKESTLKSP